jgi:hypothetical protein
LKTVGHCHQTDDSQSQMRALPFDGVAKAGIHKKSDPPAVLARSTAPVFRHTARSHTEKHQQIRIAASLGKICDHVTHASLKIGKLKAELVVAKATDQAVGTDAAPKLVNAQRLS